MKKIIFGIAVLAIAGIVALNVNLGAKKSGEVSLLALANIEALANGEEGGITCSSGSYGQCFTSGYWLCMQGEYTCYSCVFTGYQRDSCWCPC
jgi:hypothetical protein